METSKKVPPQPFASDKIYGHMDRVEEWLETGTSRPVTYELDLTNICNQKCPHCFGYYPELGQDRMHLEEAQGIIRQIKDFGGRGLTFTGGGDPLASPIVLHALAYAREVGLDVGLITNGQALTEAKCRVILKNCQWTRISIDAATPAVFEKTHGMDEKAFRQVLDGVRTLVRLKKETGAPCTLGIAFLTSAETKADIYAFAVLGRDLGVDYAQYRPLLRRHGEAEIDYSDEDVLAQMRRAESLSTDGYRVVCSEHKYRLIQQGKVERDYKKCLGQNFAAVVSADKKMYVCCHMRGVPKYELGDLSKQSLEELWNSPKRKEVADSVDFNDCPPLCRCDSFNSILWDIKENGASRAPAAAKKDHPNFI